MTDDTTPRSRGRRSKPEKLVIKWIDHTSARINGKLVTRVIIDTSVPALPANRICREGSRPVAVPVVNIQPHLRKINRDHHALQAA